MAQGPVSPQPDCGLLISIAVFRRALDNPVPSISRHGGDLEGAVLHSPTDSLKVDPLTDCAAVLNV